MALRDRAVLTMTVDGTEGQFHFIGCEPTEELNREFLMGHQGQVIQEFIDIFTDSNGDGGSQAGAFIDGGQGTDTITLSFTGGHERDEYHDIQTQWGDGSEGVDRWDAAGAHPQTQAQVLKWWARNTRTDSISSQAYLHWGEWTDGSINGEAGIFGEPITVVISQVRIERRENMTSAFDGTVELIRASSLANLSDEHNPANAIPNF